MRKDNSNVIKHPFRVKKGGFYKYYVYNEETKETWRNFDSRRDAYECAFYLNGNTGQYNRSLWY